MSGVVRDLFTLYRPPATCSSAGSASNDDNVALQLGDIGGLLILYLMFLILFIVPGLQSSRSCS